VQSVFALRLRTKNGGAIEVAGHIGRIDP